ncbi:transcriptional regulator [Nocardioides sp. zg-579]|uniref:Transcriptional regulator n=1 Tax=Nocardioides marmotae TaxID=2663857 RepID=A0A6I3JG28_9ACTN|nr:helix-turn-helix domain-containing protein [Nocardioides marmotae]MCR6033365.1 transcriptional regulator [Gordonia jinghuaiqii]MTB97022.1 transcriptional regulator [Nocardioides marmotae]QKE00599.1 helix-turn-helix transcriptional regulator [Nocardioides marmotae]
MSAYGQFCPVAKAMEVLDERWTLLVVRELLSGSSHFNELRRGVPRMSPALLSKRLRTLQRAGVVRRSEHGGRTSYSLTESGRELHGIVEALGVWGVRWVGELGAEDLDPHLLLWDMKRTVPLSAWPRSRTVVAIEFDDVEARVAHWWIVVVGNEIDVCDYDPGFEVTVTVRTGLRHLTRLWRGDLDWPQLLASGDCAVDGPSDVRRDLPHWLGRSALADVPRPVGDVG